MISTSERLRLISKALDKELHLEALDADEAYTLWQSQGWPDDTIEVTLWAFQEFARNSDTSRASIATYEATAASLIRHPVRTFTQWLTEHIEAFK
jgi:predicted DCC family thiol-disulfide oxidoreductase YuxK